MPPFVKRSILGNIPMNDYYNKSIYCGIYPYNCGIKRECALYAICRTAEIAEEPVTAYSNISSRNNIRMPMFTRNGYGNAIQWWNDTLWPKTTKHSEAKPGDIVIYGSDWGAGNGHVRIIEAMDDDYFYCSGGNEDNEGNYFFNIKVKREDGSGDNLTGLVGFIHNPYITDNNTVASGEEIDYASLYEKEKVENERLRAILKQIYELSEV